MEDKLKKYINNQIVESISIKETILNDEKILKIISTVASLFVDTYKNDRKILFAGNGGSAADAQHIAGELVSRFYFDRPGLSAIALTTDTSILTAIGNDYSYDKIFSRQIQANGIPGVIFFGIYNSGYSKIILNVIIDSIKMGITSIGLTGKYGGKMKDLCDYCICVPSEETPRIQESHLLIEHIICAIVEEEIFGKNFRN